MTPSADDIRAMFASVSLGAPDNAVGFVLWRITHRFQRGMDQALRSLDLTHLQFTVLAMVAWMGREQRSAVQAELARFGDIHPMQISLVLKALESKAMITRERSRGAAKAVSITPSGLATLRQAMPIAVGVQERLFGKAGRPGGALLESLVALEKRTTAT